MELWQVLVLSVVEGLTEFVPVSSTGHLILMSRLLGLRGPAVDAFSVVVQLGALLAAVVYYRRILIDTLTGVLRRQPESLALVRNILLGSLPLLGVAYLLGKRIKALLFAPLPVAAALGVGGLLMLMVERYRRRSVPPYQHAHELPPGRALTVGLCHLAALWPGTSRSLASMTGALLAGLPTAAAADFAFLLALPTLGAATLYELIKERHILHSEVGVVNMGIGLLVSFVVGWLVIAAFLRYLRGHGLLAFALYRVGLALTVIGLHSGCMATASPDQAVRAATKIPSGLYVAVGDPSETKADHIAAGQAQLRYDPRMADSAATEPVTFVTVETADYVPLILATAADHSTQENGRILVSVSLASPYVGKLADFTRAHLGQRVALVLDGEVMSTHKVRAVIEGGRMQITRCDEHACQRILSKLADAYQSSQPATSPRVTP